MQPDDRLGRLAVRAGRICESLRPAADQYAPRPPRWQHVIGHQRDIRVVLRVPTVQRLPAQPRTTESATPVRRPLMPPSEPHSMVQGRVFGNLCGCEAGESVSAASLPGAR